jgi:hypothetical protein
MVSLVRKTNGTGGPRICCQLQRQFRGWRRTAVSTPPLRGDQRCGYLGLSSSSSATFSGCLVPAMIGVASYTDASAAIRSNLSHNFPPPLAQGAGQKRVEALFSPPRMRQVFASVLPSESKK